MALFQYYYLILSKIYYEIMVNYVKSIVTNVLRT